MNMGIVHTALLLLWWTLVSLVEHSAANHDAKRLYDDLLSRGRYNKLVRPVEENLDKVIVFMGLKLSQLLYVACMGMGNT